MHFDFNLENIGEKFFPNGCSMCHSPVEFQSNLEVFGQEKEGWYLYICSNASCGAYTYAHRSDKGEDRQYEPMGILANKELRSLHDYLRSLFTPLWQYSTNTKPLLNNIYPNLVLSFTDEEGETRIGEVVEFDKANKIYTMETEFGKKYTVPIVLASKIDMRSKAYFWLAKQMRISYHSAKIPLFDFDQTGIAIDILQNINKPNTNSHESNNK